MPSCQGLALELNQDVDGEDPAVDQVRQGEVDDAVLGGEIDGGLGPVPRQRHQPLPLPPCKNDPQHSSVLSSVHHRHPLS